MLLFSFISLILLRFTLCYRWAGCYEYGVCVKICRNDNDRGYEEYIYPTRFPNNCARLSDWWQDYGSKTGRVSAVYTRGTCVVLWDREDCTGSSRTVSGYYTKMKNIHFDDRTRSVGTCPETRIESNARQCVIHKLFLGRKE